MREISRLQWQCRRGMLELDLLLQNYLENGYQKLDKHGRIQFEKLVNYPDQLLLEWLMGRIVPTDKDVAKIVNHIRDNAAG